jgi:hypothetical protein
MVACLESPAHAISTTTLSSTHNGMRANATISDSIVAAVMQKEKNIKIARKIYKNS